MLTRRQKLLAMPPGNGNQQAVDRAMLPGIPAGPGDEVHNSGNRHAVEEPKYPAPVQADAGRPTAYGQAYAELTEAVLSCLAAVDSPESSRRFVARSAQRIREASAETPEFYIGEFFNLFKDAAIAQLRTETAQGMRTLQNAQAEAAAATTELQARLAAARKAHDHEAEHEVWREREARQAECQAKIDAVTARTGLLQFHVNAIQSLATALGLGFE